MIKYRVKFKHSVIYPSTLTSGFGATYIDVDEIDNEIDIIEKQIKELEND